jgi:hypothetical protein
MTFSLPRAIREKEQPEEIREDIHPLILKRMREKGERDAPSKRRTFLRNRYPEDIGSWNAGTEPVAEPDIRESVSGDDQLLL